jgi:hypothetical protein
MLEPDQEPNAGVRNMNNREYHQKRAEHLRADAKRMRDQPADNPEQREYLDHFAAERELEADEIDHYLALESRDA